MLANTLEKEIEMDMWGILIFVAGTAGYYVSKKKPGFLFVAGIGTGMLIGAIWVTVAINRMF